jgi:hypothetical protein
MQEYCERIIAVLEARDKEVLKLKGANKWPKQWLRQSARLRRTKEV